MRREKFMNNYPCPNVGCRRSFKYEIQISNNSKVFDKIPPEIEKNPKKQASTCTNTKKIKAVVCNMQFKI